MKEMKQEKSSKNFWDSKGSVLLRGTARQTKKYYETSMSPMPPVDNEQPSTSTAVTKLPPIGISTNVVYHTLKLWYVYSTEWRFFAGLLALSI